MSAETLLRSEALSWMSELSDNNATADDPVLQPVWDYLRQNHHDLLRSPLFPVALSVSTYFALVGVYTALDLLAPFWPRLNRRRLHPDRPAVAWASLWRTLGVTARNHLFFVLPAAAAQWLWRPPTPLPRDAPTLRAFALGVLGCLVVFDFQYYVWHLLHHRVSWLYRTFHAVHHQYRRPFSLVTQHLSGWELFSVGLWATADPLLLRCHCLTAWGFMVFNVYVSAEDHCGYDFPWSMHNLVPFGLWGGAPKHDAHHRRPATNFAPFFAHWDWLGGTHAVPTAPGHTDDSGEEPDETKERKD